MHCSINFCQSPEFDSPTWVLMMHYDNRQNSPINDLPVSLYDFMFTPLTSFVKSQWEQEPDQN